MLYKLANDISKCTMEKLANKLTRLLELGHLSDDAVNAASAAGMLKSKKQILEGVSRGTKNIKRQHNMKHISGGLAEALVDSYAAVGIPLNSAQADQLVEQLYTATGGGMTVMATPIVKGHPMPQIYSGVRKNTAQMLANLVREADPNPRLTNIIVDRHEKDEGRALARLYDYITKSPEFPDGSVIKMNPVATGGHLSPAVLAEEQMLVRRLNPLFKDEDMPPIQTIRNLGDYNVTDVPKRLGITEDKRINAKSRTSLIRKAKQIERKAWKAQAPKPKP